jgi:hypothetical protein
VTLALAVSLCVSAGCGREPAATYRADATVRDLMQAIVDPAADAIWESVEVVATLDGVVRTQPETDEDWQGLRRHAITLMEAGDLLMIPGRRVADEGAPAGDARVDRAPGEIEQHIAGDRAAWVSHARTLQRAAARTIEAIDAKNVTALTEAGEALDLACERCHQTYWYRASPQPVSDPPPRPER